MIRSFCLLLVLALALPGQAEAGQCGPSGQVVARWTPVRSVIERVRLRPRRVVRAVTVTAVEVVPVRRVLSCVGGCK